MLIGLGQPITKGISQPTTFFGVFGRNMSPGYCCYDPNRPALLPSWIASDAEAECISSTNNCASDVASLTPPAPPTSACAGTISVDANGNKICTQVAGVNDPQNTQGGLSTSGTDFATQWAAWIASVGASAKGLTPGDCPNGYSGTYPNCIAGCPTGQDASYDANQNLVCTPSTTNWLLIAGVALVAIVALSGGVAAGRQLR